MGLKNKFARNPSESEIWEYIRDDVKNPGYELIYFVSCLAIMEILNESTSLESLAREVVSSRKQVREIYVELNTLVSPSILIPKIHNIIDPNHRVSR